MDYQESRAYIEDAQQYGSVLGLANMKELLNRLGNPQNDSRYIHVAGTNGKGSVIAYLYASLTAAGYRVGRYISPTIYSYRERLETAGEKISREQFAGYITQIAKVIDTMTAEGLGHPTPFEIETAAAFLYFKDQNCDLVLLEVGLGGNLDATNVIAAPILSVLVSISIDHQAFLGTTLKEIAEKKAGIIKRGTAAVAAAQKPEAMAVIREQCEREGVPLYIADPSEAEPISADCFGQSFRYRGEEWTLSLSGTCQIENAVLALNVMEVLGQRGYPVPMEARKYGLCHTVWGGRFTVIGQEPLFLVDGAHNPAAAEKLRDSMEQYLKGRTIYFIMGVFRDKDYRQVISLTHSYAKKILTVATPGNPRALPAKELAEAVREAGTDAEAAGSLEEAVDKAIALAGKDDVILAFGSLSFIGELTKISGKKREDK